MKKEMKYYGVHACLTLWEKRPTAVIRVYIDPSLVKRFKPLLKWCAENKKAYHIVPQEELNRVSDSVHHEGICILAHQLDELTFEEFLKSPYLKNPSTSLLYLDGVQNPHNLGSIMRCCAHFGTLFILGKKGVLPPLSPSACRIAKGAAEVVRFVHLDQPQNGLKKLQSLGFELMTTSSHGGTSLYDVTFPKRSLLIMGSESEGVSQELFALASQRLLIPGTGLVESLNVSVATSVCLSEYYRQNLCKPVI